MAFYIRPEIFCNDCGYPIDQCICLYPDDEEVESEEEVRDEDYL